jgi:hypothetical protein
MFTQNDVLEYTGMHGHMIRVLWIDRSQALAWTYRLGSPSALPEPVLLLELEEALRAGGVRRLLVDPFAAAPPQEPVPQGYLALQAKAWSAVRALHADRQALYEPRERAILMAGYAATHGISKSSILRYLRRYWERGQTPDALLPDYGNSGAPGRMRAIFRAAAARYAASHDDFSRRAAYRQMLGDFFQGQDAGGLPSFGQFNYWLERDAAAPPAVTLTRPCAPLPGRAAPRFAQHAAMP